MPIFKSQIYDYDIKIWPWTISQLVGLTSILNVFKKDVHLAYLLKEILFLVFFFPEP